MIQKDDILEATLAWCNEQRANQGKEPLTQLPKGRQRDPNSCPCGKATDLTVHATHFWSPITLLYYDLPLEVQDFVNLFDKSQYPELIEYE